MLASWEWPSERPTALLLHGVGNYGRYWDRFAGDIGSRLRLIAPDARGHGDSGAPPTGYAPGEFVADALAVLDAHGVEQALVVGHSMGGTHAIRLAAAHPERVRGLVIVDASPEPLAEGGERARRLSLERPAGFASEDDALAYLRRTSPGYDDEVYADRLRWAFRREEGRLVWRSSPAALSQIFRGRSAPGELWDRLREVRCPSLVIRGTRSNVLSADVARRMTSILMDGALVELEAGHNVPLERPAELADAVMRFAQSL